MRLSVDAWDPSYGSSDADVLDASTATVNVETEIPAGQWAPRGPATGTVVPETVWFVDGVRRVEARAWVEEPDGTVFPGLLASFAAGVVRCGGGSARVVGAEVGRGLFTAAPSAAALATTCGVFAPQFASGSAPDVLSLRLQEEMTAAEIRVAAEARAAAGDVGLLVVDGPLRGRPQLAAAVGLIKTHHIEYLPAELTGVLTRLAPGQRTPVFTIGGAWTRHSWYLRLPGPPGGPRAGIVRIECQADVDPPSAVALADVTAAVLPRFASAPHKDARAPQNLYAIAGLERELRRRLGDTQFLYRALRAAAAAAA